MPERYPTIVGQQIGNYRVVSNLPPVHGKRLWLCVCIYGVTHRRSTSDLYKARNTAAHACRGNNSKEHRKSAQPEHLVWCNMLQRVFNPNNPGYPNYGGRGVTVCEQWLTFDTFLADMGKRPSPKHSLDRVDNNAGYFPGNCRWATREEQQNNTRSNRLITIGSETMNVRQWAKSELAVVTENTFRARLRYGWDAYRALTAPPSFVGQRAHKNYGT